MEELAKKFEQADRALNSFAAILDEEYSVIVRDAAIQRFEYTFETTWKTLKIYLSEKEGIIANSPKSVFRECLTVGLLSSEDVEKALQMTDDRNLTSHTYIEELAKQIYQKLPGYCQVMTSVLKKVQNDNLGN